MARLRADRSLLPGAVEELLRFTSPVNHTTFRFTAEPVKIGGTPGHPARVRGCGGRVVAPDTVPADHAGLLSVTGDASASTIEARKSATLL